MRESNSRTMGIYVVANKRSEELCKNLIHSIRLSGCSLPIRLIPFGGEPVTSTYILQEVEVYPLHLFPKEGLDFINKLRSILVDCPIGFLYRFLAWFSDWDRFIYTDNDVVALMNWEKLIDFTYSYDFVHADEEYTTNGKFNYDDPQAIEQIFGEGSLLSAFTAGHFAARKTKNFVGDMSLAIDWFKKNPTIAKKHDQALMHIASLVGNWKLVNLCRPPHNWLSSWAGDYSGTIKIIQSLQNNPKQSISHIHYSGSSPSGTRPIDELLYVHADPRTRLKLLVYRGLRELSGYEYFKKLRKKVLNRLKK